MKRHRLLQTLFLMVFLIGYAHPTDAIDQTRQTLPILAARSVAWNHDASQLAVGYTNGNIEIWDAERKELALTFHGHDGNVQELAWDSTGSRLASGGIDQLVKLWDINNGSLIRQYTGAADMILGLIWSADNSRLLATTAEVLTLHRWNVETGQLDYQRGRVGSSLGQMAWSPDQRFLGIAGLTGTVAVLDAATYEVVRSLQLPEVFGRDVYAIAWSPDSQYLISGSRDGIVRIWDWTNGQMTHELRATDNPTIAWETSTVQSVGFDTSGAYLMSAAADGTVRSWRFGSMQLIEDRQLPSPNPVYAADFSPYGGQLAVGGEANLNTSRTTGIEHSVIISLGDGSLSIVVPAASAERLAAIATACNAPSSLIASAAALDAAAFTAQVRSLPTDAIPPACAADLLAVTEALAGQ